ncbi:MAG: ATP-grasp domain-containing protein, partial [Candidatus Omnitrophota bacterium]
RVTDSAWVSRLVSICRKEKIDIVLPGIEQDVKAFRRNRKTFRRLVSAFIMLNSECALTLGFDKLALYQFAKQHHIVTPATWPADADGIRSVVCGRFRGLLKPRSGMAGKGIYAVDSMADFDFWKKKIDSKKYLLQRRIGSESVEFTVSVFGFRDKTTTVPLILKRKLNYGSTFEAWTVTNQNLSRIAAEIARLLRVIGPTNFQFRRRGGAYYLIDVNPRFSSSVSIKARFGFNEALMAVQSFVLGRKTIVPQIKKGRCSRYIEDSVKFG